MTTADGSSGEDELMFEARHGSHRRIFNLVAQGADIHARDDLERTPLILSTVSRDIRNTLVLLRGGGNIKDKDVGGDTPLHWAVYHKNAPVARLLLKKGADMEHPNHKGQTPLQLALEESDEAVVNVFVTVKTEKMTVAFTKGTDAPLTVRSPLTIKPRIKLKLKPRKPL